MFVSPRFRDIFSPRPVRTRRSDSSVEKQDERAACADASPEADAESMWLDITAAHRRAFREFTPEFIRAADLATDEE